MSSDDLRKLRAKGFDRLPVKETAEEQMRTLQQETRTEAALEAADTCLECKSAPDGLCREHLAKALGF